ncbi:helix-turn-helix domain-containing protein, partial [Streptomyces sp. NPDC004561]
TSSGVTSRTRFTAVRASCGSPNRTAYRLLGTGALRSWADGLLGRLDGDGRDLRGTLRAWLAADANAEHTAEARGVHAQTVREHVRAAEPVLERRLLTGGTDLYEVVLAHLVTGELAVPALGPANRDQPDSAVHG